jgi:hypothetical protein
MVCHLRYDDFTTEYRGSGISANVGDRIDALMGYDTTMQLVYSGNLTKVRQQRTLNLDIKLESLQPDSNFAIPNQYNYFLTHQNILGVRSTESSSGIVKQVRTVGLPDVGLNHRIGVAYRYIALQSRFPLVRGVVHNFDRKRGFLTTVTI